MNKEDIEQIVRNLFKDNYRIFPESYPNDDKETAIRNATNIASGYWTMRNANERQRDYEVSVTLADYENWTNKELTQIIENK